MQTFMPSTLTAANGRRARLIALGGRDAAGREYRLGTREYGWHQHVRGQLLCVESGLLHVRTAHGDWVLPPQRAGWIPPATQHRVQVCGALSGWSLLLAPEACNDLSNAPCVIGISPCCRRWLSVRKVGTNAARLPRSRSVWRR